MLSVNKAQNSVEWDLIQIKSQRFPVAYSRCPHLPKSVLFFPWFFTYTSSCSLSFSHSGLPVAPQTHQAYSDLRAFGQWPFPPWSSPSDFHMADFFTQELPSQWGPFWPLFESTVLFLHFPSFIFFFSIAILSADILYNSCTYYICYFFPFSFLRYKLHGARLFLWFIDITPVLTWTTAWWHVVSAQ